ncbi:MAG: exodeoxyribonuclease VII large subunit, partial [Candidatus Omnitrophota bacterium]|nr:exodeoxyribonuclease VII large subunit [Candidatus Omnitrophota bacterium]
MSEEFLTISELNHYIKDVISAGFPRSLWICGEIQGYDIKKEKENIFFELVENGDKSEILAKIRIVIFAPAKRNIQRILEEANNAFVLKDDIEVKFLCKVCFYKPYGVVQLEAESIDPSYTLGKLAQEKQKLIAQLKQKGTFDKNKTLNLPLIPLHVGLITSYNSAAYNDFCSELAKSCFGFNVFVRNTIMQGKRTEKDVCRAIDELEKIKDLDAIVITRGGGSLADLADFDSALIAERIAVCHLPVLSGIGHEINVSITDMAAHTHAKTPTAIAQFLVARVNQFRETLNEKTRSLIDCVREKMNADKQLLKDAAMGLQRSVHHFLRHHREVLVRFAEAAKIFPFKAINDQKKILQTGRVNIVKVFKNRLQQEQLKMK